MTAARCAAAAGALVVAGLLGCGGADPVLGCGDADGIHPICGLQNPEDLAVLPDGRTLLVSQFGGMEGEAPGNLALLDLASETVRVAWEAPAEGSARPDWGDAGCPGPPPTGFAPHGLDLTRRPDGRLQLLVVNHGGRESVEFFEVLGDGPDTRVEWRGCASPPEGAFLNDVAALPDGGFLVTHMMDRDAQLRQMLAASFGYDTGFVYEWQPDLGFAVVEGTAGPFPNGIVVSEDGSEIFLNLYLGSQVRRIDRASGETLAVAEVRQPDNTTWGRDGRLLVASHRGGFGEQMACQGIREGACGFAFAIVSLDPETMTGSVVFEHGGAPMGGATVAVDIGGELVMGSFAGDRVIRATPRDP